MNNEKLKADIESEGFTDELVHQLHLSNDVNMFLWALAKDACPAGFTVDVFQSPNARVREAVANHSSTPASVVEKLATDSNKKVAKAARSRVQ